MKITEENILGLLDQFHIGTECDVTGIERSRLAAFLVKHLNPDKNVVEERRVLECQIDTLEALQNLSKKNLKDLQDKCPHDETESIYSYDGMSLSKCNVCHKSLIRQGN